MTAQTDRCESCGVNLILIPGGWIEFWRIDGPRAAKELPVHTPERCRLLRRLQDAGLFA